MVTTLLRFLHNLSPYISITLLVISLLTIGPVLPVSFVKLANGCNSRGLILQIPKTINFKKIPIWIESR